MVGDTKGDMIGGFGRCAIENVRGTLQEILDKYDIKEEQVRETWISSNDSGCDGDEPVLGVEYDRLETDQELYIRERRLEVWAKLYNNKQKLSELIKKALNEKKGIDGLVT